MTQTKRKTKKRSVKATTPLKGEQHPSDFEKEMAERVAALIAAGKMPAFEDVLKAVRKVRERELEASLTHGDEHD
jgi:hypothetical protein